MTPRVQRVVLCIWLIGVPGLVLPWVIIPSSWDSRELQAAGLPVLALVATALAWWHHRGPLRLFGILLAYLGINVLLHGFRPVWAASIAGAIVATILFAQIISLKSLTARLPSILALVGTVHLLAFVTESKGFHWFEWIFFSGGENPRSLGATGLADNPNLSSAMLAMALPWMILWWYRRVRQPQSSLWQIAAVLAAPVALVGVSIWAFVAWKTSGGVGAVLFGAVVACVAYGIHPFKATVVAAFPMALYLLYDPPTALKSWGRLVPWRWAIVEPMNKWWTILIGHGLGSWSVFAATRWREIGVYYHELHNDFLQAWFELGYIGLALLLFLLGACFLAFWRERKTDVGLAGLASLSAWVGSSFWYFPLYTAALGGIAVALIFVAQECYEQRQCVILAPGTNISAP